MSTYPAARSNIRATVKTTAAIINLIVIIIMDEIYGAIARWLTIKGERLLYVKKKANNRSIITIDQG